MADALGWIGIVFAAAGYTFAVYERGRRKGLEDAEKLFDPVMRLLNKVSASKQSAQT